MTVGILHHDLFAQHLAGYSHPESPRRFEAIMKRLRGSSFAPRLAFIEAESASEEWLALVHDPEYVKRILSLEVDEAVILDWGDTIATKATPRAALLAAGAGAQAARLVLDGTFGSAFCCVRPPGHHAERGRAMGFCVFNNVAVAAAYLVEEEAVPRVAVVDWDVHHGNGTERMFLDDDRVLYISLHQYPHYPGTGSADTVGTGRGVGYTLNLPMGAGAGDREYLLAFSDRVVPALDAFKPLFILVSAGFDGHAEDPLSSTLLTSPAYGRMTAMLRECAERHCGGRIVSMLEGGYDIAALADSVEEHVKALFPE